MSILLRPQVWPKKMRIGKRSVVEWSTRYKAGQIESFGKFIGVDGNSNPLASDLLILQYGEMICISMITLALTTSLFQHEINAYNLHN